MNKLNVCQNFCRIYDLYIASADLHEGEVV